MEKEINVFGVTINIRNLIASMLISVIVFGCIYIWLKKDSIFKNEATIKYGNGCVEKYENGILITEKCPEPELLYKPRWTLNLSQNLT